MHENRETSETPAVEPGSRSAGEGNSRTARAYVSEESHNGIVPMNHSNKDKTPLEESGDHPQETDFFVMRAQSCPGFQAVPHCHTQPDLLLSLLRRRSRSILGDDDLRVRTDILDEVGQRQHRTHFNEAAGNERDVWLIFLRHLQCAFRRPCC